MLLLILGHLRYSLILIVLILLPLHGLCPEHPGQQFGVVTDSLEFAVDLLLILFSLLKLRNIVALVLAGLFLDFFEAFLHLVLIRVHPVNLLQVVIDLVLCHLQLLLFLVELVLGRLVVVVVGVNNIAKLLLQILIILCLQLINLNLALLKLLSQGLLHRVVL